MSETVVNDLNQRLYTQPIGAPRVYDYMHAMPSPVRDNPALARFELDIDGHMAIANYRLSGDVMIFTHTEVPYALRERGIGSRLVHGALEAAKARGLKVQPRCSFVGSYIARHPEFLDLLA